MTMWGYARVSSKEQDVAKQVKALKEAGVDQRHIITEKQSGKSVSGRREYLGLVGTEEAAGKLQAGDCLAVASIDRLGRNYDEIRQQWEYITRELGADICVLDLPLLDTRKTGADLDQKFIADLVLQILSYVAERERQNIRQRQADGYAALPRDDRGRHVSRRTGRPVGRQEIEKPANWDEVYSTWKRGEITAVEAMKRTGLTKSTFYKMAKTTA